MSMSPVLFGLMGLLVGTTLLTIGIAIGFWIGKREVTREGELTPTLVAEKQQIVSAIRNMANWTTDFAGDFTRYQSTMESLSRAAADGKTASTQEGVKRLLDQIVNANDQLQRRLDSSEQKLKVQTQQLAGYLTEARTDALTGLPNRRAFDQKLDECFTQWQQTKQAFSMALIDIDHFKNVNDTFGHPAGDAVLREIAACLNDLKNESLMVARYGGEEFALLLDGDERRAAAIVDRLRLNVAGTACQGDSLSIPITISIGIARIEHADERVGKLVQRSDEALYRAKTAGRNRVYLHNGVLCESYAPSPASPVAGHEEANTHEIPPTIDELEHRVLARLDRLVSQEANRKE